MITRRDIFEIHRLKDQDFSERQIANRLHIDRKSVRKYLQSPEYRPAKQKRKPSKLDPYRDYIKELVSSWPDAKAPVILQRITERGFDGEITILKNYLRELRSSKAAAFVRFESDPGGQFQCDWGHFGSLVYGDTKRMLYALVVLEAYSRMLYVHFSHSQNQASLHLGLLEAFHYFGGTSKEMLVDNMVTAVTERVGPLIRFNETFLDFLLNFGITPVACNVRRPNEKGKVESGVKYVRQNFIPLRSFKDLEDVQSQALQWLDGVANIRIHQTTGERPADRLKPQHLKKLPEILPDCRRTETLKVHSDFCVRFDGNTYTVPPWAIGKRVTLKADNRTVSIYHKDRLIAAHARSWHRHMRVELETHKEQVRKLRKRVREDRSVTLFLSMGQVAADYLEALSDAGLPLRKTVSRLLALQDRYDTQALVYALNKALTRNLYDAGYIENILYQEMIPEVDHPLVVLKKKDLNDIRLPSPSLERYDAHAVRRSRKNGR